MRSSSSARTMRSARSSTWSASRPSSATPIQADIFRMIPGLQNAQFARLGGLHRNTFLNSPKLLDRTLRLKAMPRLRFAGQITGCEGYVEVGRDRAARRPLRRGRAARRGRRSCRRSPPPSARSSTTSPAAMSRPTRAGHALVPADERQFRPVPADRGRAHRRASASRRQRKASPGSGRSRRGRSPTSTRGWPEPRRAVAQRDPPIAGVGA